MKGYVAGLLFLSGAIAATSANADMIVPTGGILSSLGSETVISGPGSYEVHGRQRDFVIIDPWGTQVEREVAWGDAEVLLTLDSLSLIGHAAGFDNDPLGWRRWQGSVSGTIAFDVVRSDRFRLAWTFLGDDYEAQASIYGANGLVAHCVGSHGCSPNWPNEFVFEQQLTLDEGHYELRFSSYNFWSYGSGDFNDFSFSLSPVPLPAAVWLLLSGVGGLAFVRRRKQQ